MASKSVRGGGRPCCVLVCAPWRWRRVGRRSIRRPRPTSTAPGGAAIGRRDDPRAPVVRADAARRRAVVAIQDARRQGAAVVPHLQGVGRGGGGVLDRDAERELLRAHRAEDADRVRQPQRPEPDRDSRRHHARQARQHQPDAAGDDAIVAVDVQRRRLGAGARLGRDAAGVGRRAGRPLRRLRPRPQRGAVGPLEEHRRFLAASRGPALGSGPQPGDRPPVHDGAGRLRDVGPRRPTS